MGAKTFFRLNIQEINIFFIFKKINLMSRKNQLREQVRTGAFVKQSPKNENQKPKGTKIVLDPEDLFDGSLHSSGGVETIPVID